MRCSRNCFCCEFDDCIKPEQFDMGKSIRNRRYYEAHKEKENARSTAYSKSHREQINERKRRTYDKEARHRGYLRWKARKVKEQNK